MNKQITELKLNEIENVVGGVYATTSAVQVSTSIYKTPVATTWQSPSVGTKPLAISLV